MAGRRVHQKDVAARAGVSQAIVSAVFNGRTAGAVRISAATEQRVREAIRELGYVPNPAARRLAGGQNRLLGVFTYEPLFPVEPTTENYPFLVGIEREAAAQDYNLLLFTQANAADGGRTIYRDGVNALQLADGAVLFGHHVRTDELRRLLREGFPFVFIGRREVSGEALSFAVAAHVESSAALVARVIAVGHRRLAYLRDPAATEPAHDREAGYRLAHERQRLPLDERLIRRVRRDDLTPAFLRELLQTGVTACITEDTALAEQILVAARALGREVPGDCSLVALGDAMTAPPPPEITTLIVPRQEIGARAVRLLIERLAQPGDAAPRQIYVPCAVAAGRTLEPPPRAS